MSLCPFTDAGPSDNGKTLFRCPTCEAEVRAKSLPKRTCRFLGPGGYLLRLLSELGVPPLGCGCKSVAVKMDRGPDWCEAHRAELEAALVEAGLHSGKEPAWLVTEAIRRAKAVRARPASGS
jgi:hypothetical protein